MRNLILRCNISFFLYGQIMGLTASPGTNRAKDKSGAKDHLLRIMTNLDVKELSVVKEYESSLLKYSSKLVKGQCCTCIKRQPHMCTFIKKNCYNTSKGPKNMIHLQIIKDI